MTRRSDTLNRSHGFSNHPGSRRAQALFLMAMIFGLGHHFGSGLHVHADVPAAGDVDIDEELQQAVGSEADKNATSDDSTRLAARAAAQGVDVTLDVAAEMIHGFHGLPGVFPESGQALARVAEFVRRHVP